MSGRILLMLLLLEGLLAAKCRDRRVWPYATNSIWNVPIGSEAQFVPANLYSSEHCGESDPTHRVVCPGWNASVGPAQCVGDLSCCQDARAGAALPCYRRGPKSIHSDQDYFVITSAEDPLLAWYNQGWWGPGDHCALQNSSELVMHLHVPVDFVCPNGFGSQNNAVGFLLPDNVTVLQTQPVYRCSTGPTSPLLSRVNTSNCCPQQYPMLGSILGDGMLGAHGGSGLSAVGGMVREGELLPGAPRIRHALKLEFFAHEYYYGGHDLNPVTKENGGRTQYVWPATGSDSCTRDKNSAFVYNGTNEHLAPGSLLAIPSTHAASVTTTTIPGGKIKQALVEYGGYLVDDTASDTAAICMEATVSQEFQDAYGYALKTKEGPWYEDLLLIFRALHIVVNNEPASVGGGGTPLVPLAPPICPL